MTYRPRCFFVKQQDMKAWMYAIGRQRVPIRREAPKPVVYWPTLY